MADTKGWTTVETEFAKDVPFGPRMVRLAREALLGLAPRARWKDRGRRAAAVLSSFSLKTEPDGSLTTGLDVEPAMGTADSGDLDRDLTDLFLALGAAAPEQETGVVFLLDEMQDLQRQELAAIIGPSTRPFNEACPSPSSVPACRSCRGSQSKRSPTPSGCSASPRSAGWTHLKLTALVEPANDLGVDYTEGYPYFVQLYGQLIWNEAQSSPIALADARDVKHLVERELDENFFRVRTDRTTETELAYLRAMAELGAQPQRAGDVAKLMKRTVEQMGTTRARLISKGLLYTPGHGFAGFTVPQFDRYMKRSFPLQTPLPRRRST